MNNDEDETGVRRYRPKAIVIVIVIITVLAAFVLGARGRALSREAKIAQAIEKLGGLTFYDEEADAKPRSRFLPRLRAVAFYARSSVSDADLALLQDTPKLRELHLGHVPISDQGLYAIRDITSLEGLALSSVPVTDVGLSYLHGLHKLRWVHLEDTLTTPAGIAALQKALPECSIKYTDRPAEDRGRGDPAAISTSSESSELKEPQMAADVIKISVLARGELLVDGVASSLEQLQQRLTNANPHNTVVWYYRENPDAVKPPPISLEVLDAVIQNRIPISLSSKPDFSNVIDDRGLEHPRE
jgi:hypothetical protein